MRVMVTGGAGFIGGHLVRRISGDLDVVVVDNYSGDSLGELPAHTTVVKLDVRATDALCESMRGCDAVVHLAANVLIKGGHRDTDKDLQHGVIGTHSVLEAMRRCDVGHICFASSSTVYGDQRDGRPVHEDAPLRPMSLYSAGKAAGEAFISAYASLFGLSATVLRLGIVLGPGLWRGAAFDFFNRLQADPRRLTVLGDGRQTKPYLDAEDCVAGFLELGLRPAKGVNAYNLASEGSLSVRQVAARVLKALNLDGVPVETASVGAGWPGDVPHLQLSIDKARAAGWAPRYSPEEVVDRYVRSLVGKARPAQPAGG
jgi:UDP-glucose 4-epimerase